MADAPFFYVLRIATLVEKESRLNRA
jgi:hypothetical protein